MNKIIKNYTTDIPAEKTINEIQQLLSKNGARAVAVEYDTSGLVQDIFFKIDLSGKMLSFRLPAKPENVYNALYSKMPGQKEGPLREGRMKKSNDIAWRICKTWIEAQLTLINLEQATIQQVFLPYLLTGQNQTLYQQYEKNNFILPSGDNRA